MSANIQVKCSGSLYASLHCELINQDKNQEGFLVGEIEKFTSHSISDSEINNENVNININISGYIPCSSVGSFYSGCGRINSQYLKHIAGHNTKKIVGWYRSRSLTETLFLKETRVHEQLRKEFGDSGDYFLFALLSKTKPAITGKFDLNYKFHIMFNNNEFEGVSLTIVNMKDTSTSQYIKTSSSVLYDSDSLRNIVGTIQNKEPGVMEAETLHSGLLNQIRTLLPKYSSVQEQYHEALERVNKLRESCHRLGFKITSKMDESEDNDFDFLDGQCSPSILQSNTVKSQKADPFDFVEKETSKELGSAKKKICKTKKENVLLNEKSEPKASNDIKNKKISKTFKKSGLGLESPLNSKTSGVEKTQSTCSPSQKKVAKENSLPPISKTLEGSQISTSDNGKEAKDTSLVKVSNSAPKTPKEKDDWTEEKMSSDSPEF